jgi:hypothetical protein
MFPQTHLVTLDVDETPIFSREEKNRLKKRRCNLSVSFDVLKNIGADATTTTLAL